MWPAHCCSRSKLVHPGQRQTTPLMMKFTHLVPSWSWCLPPQCQLASMPSLLIPGAMPWQRSSCSPQIHSHHADLPAGPSNMCTPLCFVTQSLRFVEAEQLGNRHVNLLPPSNRKQSTKPSRWKGMGYTWWCQLWCLPARLFSAK